MLHAESNCILKIARTTIYCTYSCIECAKLIIQSGIVRFVYANEYRSRAGIELLEQSGVEVMKIDN